MTSDTDLRNEVRCGAAVRRALEGINTPAQAAFRFVLDKADFASRVIGVSTIDQLDAFAHGPLPTTAASKLERLWANDFKAD